MYSFTYIKIGFKFLFSKERGVGKGSVKRHRCRAGSGPFYLVLTPAAALCHTQLLSRTVALSLGNPRISFCSKLRPWSTPTCMFSSSSWFSSPPTGSRKISKQRPSSQASDTTNYTISLTFPGSGSSSADANSLLRAEVELRSFHGVSLRFPPRRGTQASPVPRPSSLQRHLPHLFSAPLPNSFHLSLFSKALLSAGTCKISNLPSIASAVKHIPSNAITLTKHIGCKRQGLGSWTAGCLQGGGSELPSAGPIHFQLALPRCEQPPALQSLSQSGAPALASHVVKINKVSKNSPTQDCFARDATRTHI